MTAPVRLSRSRQKWIKREIARLGATPGVWIDRQARLSGPRRADYATNLVSAERRALVGGILLSRNPNHFNDVITYPAEDGRK